MVDFLQEDMLECVCCNLCQSSQATIVMSVEMGVGQSLQLTCCSKCGLIYMNPRPTLALMKQLYDQPYYTHLVKKNLYEKFKTALLRALAKLHFGYVHLGAKNRLDPLIYWMINPLKGKWLKIPYYVPNGRLLDVGCGNGDYLETLSGFGWKCLGTELSEKAAACARSRGLEVLVGDLLDLSLPSKSFDVVTLWDVVEHLHDPMKALIQINRLLQMEGIVIIGTPNVASDAYGRFGRDWHGLHLPYHLNLFKPETLTMALQAAGFDVIFVKLYTSPRGLALDIRRCITNNLPISVDTLYRYTSRFDLALLPIAMGMDLFACGDNMIAWARKVREIDE